MVTGPAQPIETVEAVHPEEPAQSVQEKPAESLIEVFSEDTDVKVSAVLVSGALAIMYLITFAAYSFYGLFPQLMAFGLMLLFTVFGVVAALNYNKQVIAHIGLVGAYAVPFLLSSGSGDVATLFTYMVIINVGIMVISLKKYWKSLFYSAFGLTWLIYISWNAFSYESEIHFNLALIFAGLFFIIFYISFLAYKLAKSEKFQKTDVVLVLLNSFIFYAIGYGLLNHHETGKHLLGLFTLANAIVHFAVATLIYRKKLADRNLFYLISGMVLVFITIAIPVQLDGNWVTLLWTLQAALLSWAGRTKGIPFYEKLSYPLMVLGFLSLMQDWAEGYGGYFGDADAITPILNAYFLTSVLFIGAFTGIHWINSTKPGVGYRYPCRGPHCYPTFLKRRTLYAERTAGKLSQSRHQRILRHRLLKCKHPLRGLCLFRRFAVRHP